MRRTRAVLICSLLLLVAGPAVRAQVAITEVMYNPFSTEPDWEWIEIWNGGSAPVDLTGWVVDDINSTAHGASNVAAVTLGPGEVGILYNADRITGGAFAAAWSTTAVLIAVTDWDTMQLGNGGDTVSLWDSFAAYQGDHQAHANAVDTVPYTGDGVDWPLDDGSASIFLLGNPEANGVGANWSLSLNLLDDAYSSQQNGTSNSGVDVGSPGIVPAGLPVELQSFSVE